MYISRHVTGVIMADRKKSGDGHSLLLNLSLEEKAILDEKAGVLGLDRSSFLRFLIRTADVFTVTTCLRVSKKEG